MLWENRQKLLISDLPPNEDRAFTTYLEWLHTHTRTHLKPALAAQRLGSDSTTHVPEDEYDVRTREGTQVDRAPVERYVVSIPILGNSLQIENN